MRTAGVFSSAIGFGVLSGSTSSVSRWRVRERRFSRPQKRPRRFRTAERQSASRARREELRALRRSPGRWPRRAGYRARTFPRREISNKQIRAVPPSFARSSGESCSDVEILDVERVILDEFAALLDVFAHQRGKHLLGLHHVLELHFQQRASLGVHGGGPELVGIHFAQALETR